MNGRILISVVSPVYGCRDSLGALADAVARAFENTSFEWELVLVDDRAADNPWPVISEMAARDPRIRGIRLTRNHGQHLAIWAGLEAARGNWIAVIDCDLQDDPQIIPSLYEKAVGDGVDAVVVDRGEWLETGFRRLASRMFYRFLEALAGFDLSHKVGNYGIYSRRLVDLLLRFRDKEVFLPVMVALTGLPRARYTLERSNRHQGESTYNFWRLLRMAILIIIRFSSRPLQLSVVIGLTFSGLSALFSVVLVFAWITGAFSVPGWTSLILSLWFLAGLILAVLGVHGFYVGRIFSEVQDRPRIFVEQRTDGEAGT